MRKIWILLAVVLCLLTACKGPEKAPAPTETANTAETQNHAETEQTGSKTPVEEESLPTEETTGETVAEVAEETTAESAEETVAETTADEEEDEYFFGDNMTGGF